MLFDYDILIPAATPADVPNITLAKLTRGRLTQIRILFPPGPATLVYVSIRHNLHQLMPANPEGSINFDDAIIVSNLSYDLIDSPYEISMVGWSPLAVYEHRITCQFNLEPIEGDSWNTFNEQLFSINEQIKRR